MKKLTTLPALTVCFCISCLSIIAIVSCDRTKPPKDVSKDATGIVTGADGEILSGAIVYVNEDSTRTDDKGEFSFQVEPSDRYLMTIVKPGYKVFSKIFLNTLPKGDWKLQSAFTQAVDPSISFTISDLGNTCNLPLIAKIDWSAYPEARKAKLAQADGSLIDAPEAYQEMTERVLNYVRTLKCNTGATLAVAGNSLVDRNGNLPEGNVLASISSVSLISPEDMPGDFTAISQGRTGYMKSYGAAEISIYTDQGELLNLAPKKMAQLSIPVDPSIAAADSLLPKEIDLLLYDPVKGIWEDKGMLILNSELKAYEGEINHFSTYNADIIKEDQCCVKFDYSQLDFDESFEMGVNIFEFFGAPDEDIIFRSFDVGNTPACNGEKIHALYNLPKDHIVMIIAGKESINDEGEVVPLVSLTLVETALLQDPQDPNQPVCPYDACGNNVMLNPLTPNP